MVILHIFLFGDDIIGNKGSLTKVKKRKHVMLLELLRRFFYIWVNLIIYGQGLTLVVDVPHTSLLYPQKIILMN